jgi:hypothetical protein
MARFIAGHPCVDSYTPPPAGFGTGYIKRDYKSYPMGALKFAKAGPVIKELTDAEIIEAAKEKTDRKTWLTDHFDRLGIKVKNQSNSSYCWGHGATRSCESCYVMSGGIPFVLAAFDICAYIKGGRNQGGSGIEAIETIAKIGICTEALHKPMDFDSSRSPEQEANAALHKIEGFDDLDTSAHRLIASYVIANIGVTVGIPAWGHEVCITFIAIEGSSWYFGFDNSWGTSYGTNGRGVLHGAMSNFDEAGAVRIMTPSTM